LRAKDSPELAAARAELEKLASLAAPDRQAVGAQQREVAWLEARNCEIVVRSLAAGSERVLDSGELLKTSLAFSADGGRIYFAGAREGDSRSSEIYEVADSIKPRALTSGAGFKTDPTTVPGGKFLIYSIASQSPFPRGTSGGPAGRPGMTGAARQFAVLDLAAGKAFPFTGLSPAISADGAALVYLSQSGEENTLQYLRLSGALEPKTIRKSPERIGSASLSPDGSRVAFDMMFQRNFEVFAIGSDGSGEVRLTRDIQHDRSPRFLDATRVIAIRGESRHSRAYLYDINGGTPTRLFHNNTVRTIAPEYDWALHPAGTSLLIQAERDGDTVSPERGIYLLDLTRRISQNDLLARLRACLAAEKSLRAAGTRMFEPIAEKVRSVVDGVSIVRLYQYQEKLFDFDSKHISQPGNKLAGEYIYQTLKSFGYEPEYQWFEWRDIRSANVLATLRGSEDPDVVYVLSSHYDSNQRGPGADDNSSATAVLLETARLLAGNPLPATIVFAAFTGEEAGLLGSREFVRQAVAKNMKIVGALNNDMIGWSNDFRLDNTIRYSNAGIRDLQHAAAFLFSRMITYDARYVKATDAAAYYDAYGDIVGGIGSYPVLGSPYYHQPTDLLENINQELLVEAAKANTAAIMLLASSPSRVKELKIESAGEKTVELSWPANPEKGISGYEVVFGLAGDPASRRMTVSEPKARISGLSLKNTDKLHVRVRALNYRGMAAWDWTQTVVSLER